MGAFLRAVVGTLFGCIALGAGPGSIPPGPSSGIVVQPGQSIQAALTAVARFGGTVYIQPGIYPAPNQSFVASSSTRIVCEAGAVLTATDTNWLPDTPYKILTNANFNASITAGTYNATTGAVSLTTGANYGIAVGASFTLPSMTGTGSFASLAGTWTATAGTTGTTLNFTGPTGLTLTITGGSILVDHDIQVEGCLFQALGGFATNGAFHHINFRMTSHIRIDKKNGFIGGGDGTAMQGVLDSVVSDNWMTGANNACYDHWEASQAIVVRNNFCQTSSFYGILDTGTNTDHTSPGVANGCDIEGNTIQLAGAEAAGIWLQGVGAAGSGVSHCVVHGNHVSGDGNTNYTCLYVTGAGIDDIFAHNTCDKSGPNTIGILAANDSGGTPDSITFDTNTLDHLTITSPNIAMVEIFSNNTQVINNRISGGGYFYCFWLSAVNDIALNNPCDVGSVGTFNTSGATNPVIQSPGEGSFPTLLVGGLTPTVGASLVVGANSAGVLPTPGFALGVGFNFANGPAEVDFYDLYASATTAFYFLQLTSPTTFRTLLGLMSNGGIIAPNLPSSAGSGGLNLCIDVDGNLYKKASCP